MTLLCLQTCVYVDMCTYMRIGMCIGMCADMRIEPCADMCTDICTDFHIVWAAGVLKLIDLGLAVDYSKVRTRVWTCVWTCTDMCMNMHMGMCVDICVTTNDSKVPACVYTVG